MTPSYEIRTEVWCRTLDIVCLSHCADDLTQITVRLDRGLIMDREVTFTYGEDHPIFMFTGYEGEGSGV